MSDPIAVAEGVRRLRATFPLGERLRRLEPRTRAVQSAVLRSYVETGAPPAVSTLDEADLATLIDADAVVVEGGGIVGAYPFSSGATGHVVRMGEVTVGTMCSLDALAVAPIFGVEAVVESTCVVTGDPVAVAQPDFDRGSTVHIGVHFRSPDACAATSLCREMVFLRDAAAAAAWSTSDPDSRSVYRLPDAIAFAEAFFRDIVGVGTR